MDKFVSDIHIHLYNKKDMDKDNDTELNTTCIAHNNNIISTT